MRKFFWPILLSFGSAVTYEEVFLAHLAEFRLRGDLMSLIAAKEFAHAVADGDAPFTRQEEV